MVEAVAFAVELALAGAISPLIDSPSSPTANERLEQNPSDDEMISVSPSLDQARSVNVAQCKLLTMQIGVFCWVSYKSTESWVATAYTMRYGSANAGLGPGVDASVSTLRALDGVAPESDVVLAGGGGGSITDATVGDFSIGSGNGGSASSPDVSMVMCFVGGGDWRSVYKTGEHLTTTDGFLCPGRCAIGGLLMPPRV